MSLNKEDNSSESCLVEHNLDAIINLVPQGFLRVLAIHYIKGRPFPLLLSFNPNFFYTFVNNLAFPYF